MFSILITTLLVGAKDMRLRKIPSKPHLDTSIDVDQTRAGLC